MFIQAYLRQGVRMLGEPPEAEKFRLQITKALAVSGDERTIEDLYVSALTGAMQLWISPDSIVFTEILCYPRTKAIRAVIAAGRLSGVVELIPMIAKWGQKQGCKRAELLGRRGWVRALGWDELAFAMTPIENLVAASTVKETR